MRSKPLPRLHGTRQIVVLVADIWRGMLQHPRNQAKLIGCLHRYKSRCRATKIMKSHELAEFVENPREIV